MGGGFYKGYKAKLRLILPLPPSFDMTVQAYCTISGGFRPPGRPCQIKNICVGVAIAKSCILGTTEHQVFCFVKPLPLGPVLTVTLTPPPLFHSCVGCCRNEMVTGVGQGGMCSTRTRCSKATRSVLKSCPRPNPVRRRPAW